MVLVGWIWVVLKSLWWARFFLGNQSWCLLSMDCGLPPSAGLKSGQFALTHSLCQGDPLNHMSHWCSAKKDSFSSVKHFIIILRSSDQELIGEVPSLFVHLLNSNWGMQKVESEHWLSAGLDLGTSFLIICVLLFVFENLPGIQLLFCSKSRSMYFSAWQMCNPKFLTYVNWTAADGRGIWYFVFLLWKALFALRI